jgi:subtilisin family serine protease
MTPLALDPRPIRVMVELKGAPVTAIQALHPNLKLSLVERESLRTNLAARQEGLRGDLETLGAKVIHTYQNSYNGISILTRRAELARIRELPGVVGIHALTPKKLLSSNVGPIIDLSNVWSRGTKGFHGESIKVAVIDTGIDYTHANFGGPGTPEAYAAAHAAETMPADPSLFGPDAPRVKGGVDLVGDAYDPSSTDPDIATPHPDDNPLDCNGHGSHVAGILGGSGVTPKGTTYAGSYDVGTDSKKFAIPPGVAPRVDLYAVRVFGCNGATLADIDGIEWAVDHDMDVVNLSLGTDIAGADDPSAVAAANAVKAGVVVVAAAGNSGEHPYIAGSPASGDGVVSVAALDSNASMPMAELDLGGSSITVQNSNAAKFADGTRYPIVVLGTPDAPSDGCNAADYDRPDVPGALLVELRGNCYFSDRFPLALAAGAAGIALVNNADGYPPYFGESPDFPLPFFGVLASDAPALVAASGASAQNTVMDNPGYLRPASFSSSGPRTGDSALKPNVIAPGVAIVSTAVGTGNAGVSFSGTSMATPVVAGLAALARQAHPSWRASDIANVLANTADPTLLGEYTTRRAGTGVPQATAAVRSTVVTDAGGASALNFGFVELARDTSSRGTITLHNLSRAPASFDVSVADELTQGFPHDLSLPSSIVVPGSGQASLDVGVTLSAADGADPLSFEDFAGVLVLTPKKQANGGVTLRVPYYGVVRPEARLAATARLPTLRRPTGLLTLTNRRSSEPGSAEVFAWGIQSPEDADGCHDVRAAGVESLPYGDGDRLLVFAIDGWKRCSTASINEYDVAVQLENGDSYLVAGIDVGALQTGSFSGELGTVIVDLKTNAMTLMPAVAATDSSVVYLTALASELGLSAQAPRFAYALQVESIIEAASLPDAPTDTATFDAFHPSLLGVGDLETLEPNDTARVAVAIRPRDWASTPAKGFMVVLAENAPGAAQAALFGIGDAGSN